MGKAADRLDGHARYAVYWAPTAGSPLAALGAAWLGWDADAGIETARPHTGLDAGWLTAEPRRYGLHATLKPPFRLAAGQTAAALDRAVAALAARLAPAVAPPLTVDAALGFAALRPAGPAPALDALAADCLRGLDDFRAPPVPEDVARRRASGLSARQEAHLARWGYPHVLEDFRFHLTLTGRLAPGEAEPVTRALARLFAPCLGDPLTVAALSLFGDPGGGRPFRRLAVHALTG